VPLVFVAVWGLVALMLTAQSFSGDRTDGTERFLLERPVPRSTTWRARLAASAGSLLALLAVHVPYLWLLVDRVGDGRLPVPPGELITVAAAVVACAYVGGLIAASMVGSLQATLVGAVFAALPWGLAMVLAGRFPYAFYRSISVGWAVPVLIPLGYVVASWAMLCRGEPEGRGRWRRGSVVLVAAVLLVPVAFVSAAPVAMRMEAGRFEGGPRVVPSPSGESLVVLGGDARTGWLVDSDSGSRRRFLPQGIWEATWSADGSLVAVIHDSGRWGARAPGIRLDVFDDAGRQRWSYSNRDDVPFLANPLWAGRHLVARTIDTPRSQRFVIVDVDRGTERELRIDAPWNSTSVLGPTDDGSIFVFRVESDDGVLRSRLQRIDLETASLAEVVLEEEAIVPRADSARGVFLYWQELSPSGRFLKREHGLVDLADGRDLEPETSITSAWLEGDRYARLIDGPGKRLLIGRPDEPGEELGRWDDEVVLLFASPDRRRLMVQVWSGAEGRELVAADFTIVQRQRRPHDSRMLDLWILDAETGERIDPGIRFDRPEVGGGPRIVWSGPARLARIDERGVSLRGLGPDDRFRRLIGG
jgi:hypothetical protein